MDPADVAEVLWKVAPPVILILGTLGNGMTLVVMGSAPEPSGGPAGPAATGAGRAMMTVFFTSLTVSDTLILLAGLLPVWLARTWGVHVNVLHDATCKLGIFLVYLANVTSAWYLVGMTLQRVVAVLCPYRVATLCTSRRAKATVLLLLVVLVLLNAHLLATWAVKQPRSTSTQYIVLNTTNSSGIPGWDNATWLADTPLNTPTDVPPTHTDLGKLGPSDSADTATRLKKVTLVTLGDKVCQWVDDPGLQYYDQHVFVWLDLTVSSLIPALILIVSNSLLALILARSARSLTSSSTGGGDGGRCSLPSRRKKTTSSVTAMVMTVSVTFLVLTLPLPAYLIKVRFFTPEKGWHELGWAVVNLLWYLNSAINFFLYCVSGSRFRAQCRSLLSRALSCCTCRPALHATTPPSGSTDCGQASRGLRGAASAQLKY